MIGERNNQKMLGLTAIIVAALALLHHLFLLPLARSCLSNFSESAEERKKRALQKEILMLRMVFLILSVPPASLSPFANRSCVVYGLSYKPTVDCLTLSLFVVFEGY